MDILTEDNNIIEYEDDYDIDVKATGGEPRWQLIAQRTADDEIICIAKYESADEANAAHQSLLDAIQAGKAWDAAEFKKKRNFVPTVFTVVSGNRGKW